MILIGTATLVPGRIAVGFVRRYVENVKGALPPACILINITRLSVIVIGAMIILRSLDVSITPILTSLAVGGLAVALVLQDGRVISPISSGGIRPFAPWRIT